MLHIQKGCSNCLFTFLASVVEVLLLPSFMVRLTLLIMLGSSSNDLNNLPCRLTAAYISPPVRLATILLLVTSEKFESIDKRRSTGVEQPSLISPNFLVPILTTLLILAGDVELNPGPFKPGKECRISINLYSMVSTVDKLIKALIDSGKRGITEHPTP